MSEGQVVRQPDLVTHQPLLLTAVSVCPSWILKNARPGLFVLRQQHLTENLAHYRLDMMADRNNPLHRHANDLRQFKATSWAAPQHELQFSSMTKSRMVYFGLWSKGNCGLFIAVRLVKTQNKTNKKQFFP